MFRNFPSSVKKICIHTGNMLNLNEVKKKAGQNPTDELIESLKITLRDWKPNILLNQEAVLVFRNDDDLLKSVEEDRKELKISVKIFISTARKEALQESLENVFTTLHTSSIDSVVISYPCQSDGIKLLSGLKELWTILESFVNENKLLSIGVSDIDTELFVALYDWAQVKPSIIQINLASCCVVPPALQEFTKQHDVQLLTHSDPFEILPKSALNEVFGLQPKDEASPLSLLWALRFQVHVKCRGVLSSKGYVLCLDHKRSEKSEAYDYPNC